MICLGVFSCMIAFGNSSLDRQFFNHRSAGMLERLMHTGRSSGAGARVFTWPSVSPKSPLKAAAAAAMSEARRTRSMYLCLVACWLSALNTKCCDEGRTCDGC